MVSRFGDRIICAVFFKFTARFLKILILLFTRFRPPAYGRQAIPYGLLPDMFDAIFENMAETNFIDIFFESEKKEKLIGRSDRPFNPNLFPSEELQYLERVANQFSKTTPNEIVEISHKELAWIENELKREFISYEYALELEDV